MEISERSQVELSVEESPSASYVSEPLDTTTSSPGVQELPASPIKAKRRKRKLTVPLISITSLYNRLQTSGLVIIDCRSEEQFAARHLHGALQCTHAPRRNLSIDEIVQQTANEHLRQKLTNRDLLEVVVIGSNRSSTPLFYRRDSGYKLAQMLVVEGRVFSVQFLAQGFGAFAKKYPFLLQSRPLLCIGLYDAIPKSKETPPLQYPNEIVSSFLYLGNFWQANSYEVVKSLGITHIVNMGAITDNCNRHEGVEYIEVDIDDKVDADIGKEISAVMNFIDRAAKARGRVLVHCVQGVSRSSTIVIWYLMVRTKCTLSAAYSYVLKRRPLIFPNRGFMKQLLEKEKELYGSESVDADELDLLQHGLLPPIDRQGSGLRISYQQV